MRFSWKKFFVLGVLLALGLGFWVFYRKVEIAVQAIQQRKREEERQIVVKTPQAFRSPASINSKSSLQAPEKPFKGNPKKINFYRNRAEENQKNQRRKENLRMGLIESPLVQVGTQKFGLRLDLSLSTTQGVDQFGMVFPRVVGQFVDYKARAKPPKNVGEHRIVQDPKTGRLGLMTGYIFITFKDLEARKRFLEQTVYSVVQTYGSSLVVVVRSRLIEKAPEVEKDIRALPGVKEAKTDILFSRVRPF